MNLYKVDYNVLDAERLRAETPEVPTLVVAEDFKTALKFASKYETEYLALRELVLTQENIKIALSKKFKGV